MSDELDTVSQQFVQTDQTAEQTETPKPEQENQREQNLRILRERAEMAERRSAELERMMQMNMSQSQQSTKLEIVEEDDDFGISDDSYIEGKQLKKYVKGLKKELRETKKQIEESHLKNSQDYAEMRLKNQFVDFDVVVTTESLKKLSAAKPALFRTIMANQDIYDRGYTAYEMIKSSGLLDESYEQQDKRLQDNKSKPRSAANASPQSGDTPLARVGDYDRRILTEERKEQLRKQVEEAKMLR